MRGDTKNQFRANFEAGEARHERCSPCRRAESDASASDHFHMAGPPRDARAPRKFCRRLGGAREAPRRGPSASERRQQNFTASKSSHSRHPPQRGVETAAVDSAARRPARASHRDARVNEHDRSTQICWAYTQALGCAPSNSRGNAERARESWDHRCARASEAADRSRSNFRVLQIAGPCSTKHLLQKI